MSSEAHPLVVNREPGKFFLNRRNCIEDWIQLTFHFSYIASAVFVEVIPVILQNLLYFSKQLNCLLDNIC